MSSTATPPDPAAASAEVSGDISGDASGLTGARHHWCALEGLYASAPINQAFPSRLAIIEEGFARIHFEVRPEQFHAAGAAHGTLYFKMLDDAAFYAANTLVTDRFLLTTAFNLLFTRPLHGGSAVAEGRWISGRRRVLLAESRIIDAAGNEVGRGTGTFQRSQIALSTLPGYARAALPGSTQP